MRYAWYEAHMHAAISSLQVSSMGVWHSSNGSGLRNQKGSGVLRKSWVSGSQFSSSTSSFSQQKLWRATSAGMSFAWVVLSNLGDTNSSTQKVCFKMLKIHSITLQSCACRRLKSSSGVDGLNKVTIKPLSILTTPSTYCSLAWPHSLRWYHAPQ